MTLNKEHKTYYDLEKEIQQRIEAMSDDDIYFAYWLNYEANKEGAFEGAIFLEYNRREREGKFDNMDKEQE